MFGYLLFILFIIFAARNVFFIIGAYLERKRNIANKALASKTTVSIIVPARNEEKNIKSCIESIMKSSYHNDLMEVIAVNDRSTDSTSAILHELQNEFPNLVVLDITEKNKHTNLKGKAGALHEGIVIAKGKVILMTDADCIVNKDWVKTIVGFYADDNVAMTPAFTIIDGKTPFEKIQAIEWIYMHVMASGGIALKQPLGCYGNNLSIRKSVYNELGGYENIEFSVTEDLALLQSTFKTGKRISYLCSESSSVITFPCDSFIDYIKQRHRWAIGGMSLKWRAVVFVTCTASMWLCLMLSIYIGNYFWLASILGARIIGDFAMEFPAFNALNRKRLSLWSVPATLFFMVMELVVPFLLLKKNVVWKNQTFNRK